MTGKQLRRLREEAAWWILRLPHATVEERAAFSQWVTTSKDHLLELLRADLVDCMLAELFGKPATNDQPSCETRMTVWRNVL